MAMKIALAAVLALGLAAGLRADSGSAVSPTAQVTETKKLVPKLPAVFKRRKKPKATPTPLAAVTTGAAVAAVTLKKQHWVCPMHDGGESDHPGKCSKCGMDLVLEKD
jgi:hypothetical protein